MVILSILLEEEEDDDEENNLLLLFAAAVAVTDGTTRNGWNADDDLGALLRTVAKIDIVIDTFIGGCAVDQL